MAAEPLAISGAEHLADADIGIWPSPARLSTENTALAARIAAAVRTTRRP